jgi:hypothetical protein
MLAAGFNILELLGVCMAIVLGFVLLIVAFVAYQIWRFKRAMRNIGSAMQQAVQQMQNAGGPVYIDVEGKVVDPDAVHDELRDREANVKTPAGHLLLDVRRHEAEMQVTQVLRGAFFERSGWSDEQRAELGEHLLFVHDQLDPTQVILWFTNHTYTILSEERSTALRESIERDGARKAMADFTVLSVDVDALRVATLAEQNVDVYLAKHYGLTAID